MLTHAQIEERSILLHRVIAQRVSEPCAFRGGPSQSPALDRSTGGTPLLDRMGKNCGVQWRKFSLLWFHRRREPDGCASPAHSAAS